MIGVAGALLGGWVATKLFHIHSLQGFFNLSTWITAIAGATVLLLAFYLITGRSSSRSGRSDLADWAAYGYCASHSRYFWGLRLQMVATMHGLPVGRAGLTHIADKTATAVTSRRPWPALVSGRSQGRVLAWLHE